MPNTDTKTRFGRASSDLYSMLVIGVVLLWSLAALILVAARWIDPPTTAVHLQRRLQAGFTTRRIANATNSFAQPISADLQPRCNRRRGRALYQHHGFDWHRDPSLPR